jgi:hypothetical protein
MHRKMCFFQNRPQILSKKSCPEGTNKNKGKDVPEKPIMLFQFRRRHNKNTVEIVRGIQVDRR